MHTFKPGSIFFRVTGSSGTTTKSVVIMIVLNDPCPETKLSIVSPNVFDIDQIYKLRSEPPFYNYDLSKFVNKETYVDCGPYEINFTYEDGSSIDRELFEDDQTTYPNFKFLLA